MNIAIVGAGINGLYLSWKLSGAGHQVTVFEKNVDVGNKVCSGLFSKRILDFIPESKKLIENKINFAILHFPKKDIKLNFSKEFLVMNRSELDKMVLKLAQKRGATIILNKEVKKLPFGFDRIIGCDGANSVVRQKLKLSSPKLRLGIQGYCNARRGNAENFVETWPTKNGFIWKIPRRNKIEYGIIEEINSAKKLFDNFLLTNYLSSKLFKKIKATSRPLDLKDIGSKLIPQGLLIPKNTYMTLCGDAAGLTKPWSGGGVIWGLKAADILIKTFPDFLAYRKEVLNFFTSKIIIGKIATKAGYFMGFKTPFLMPKKIKIESDFLL